MTRQTSIDHYAILDEIDSKSPFIQEDNYYHYEDDQINNTDEVTGSVNWDRAVALNEKYARDLGWINNIYAINDLLIQATGQNDISLHGEAFAQAVAVWQQQQGFSAKDADGIIGPNTWRKMQPLLRTVPTTAQLPITTSTARPSPQNIFEFNKWHAQRILDKMNAGIFGTNFNSRSQLEKILRGEQVLRIDPNQAIIKVLPIIDHIGEQAANENYSKIIIGSFIRDATNGKCTGHCAGRCIDINFKEGNFNTSGSVEMVIKILSYLLSMPSQFKQSLGFGMPLQGDFFGNQSITKFKSVPASYLLNAELRTLVPQLGIVFPDNDNHLHIQVNWQLQSMVSNTTSTTTAHANTVPVSSNAQAEWLANPGIKARYPNWQMYEAKRNDVLGWGISNPAPYIENAIQEWNANPGVHRHFGNNFDGDPHQSYLNLKRLYQAKGVTNPANYFTTNIVSISFFNRSTPGHINLKQALNNAQSSLISRGYNFNLVSAWSFVPRTFNTNINKLSNHALGKAIDIDPSVNPHIVSNEEILVINTVCRSILPAGLLAESNPDTLRQASDHFRNTFTSSWINQQTQSSVINAIQNKRSNLDKYARNGFLNLPPVFVRALQSAGLGWGGTWRSSKDFMHFELP